MSPKRQDQRAYSMGCTPCFLVEEQPKSKGLGKMDAEDGEKGGVGRLFVKGLGGERSQAKGSFFPNVGDG